MSQIELNRPMKGVSFWRANHAELGPGICAPSSQCLLALEAHLLAQSGHGILVLCRAVLSEQRVLSVILGNPGATDILPRFSGTVLDIAPERGLG